MVLRLLINSLEGLFISDAINQLFYGAICSFQRQIHQAEAKEAFTRFKSDEIKSAVENLIRRKLAFMLLMMFCFLLGTLHRPAMMNSRNLTQPAIRQIGGDPFSVCEHVTWHYYCAGQPGCNCILTSDPKTGCGDGLNRCCATCFHSTA